MEEKKESKTLEQHGRKLRANLTAVLEWFKSAAWLQVILIVGIIFALLLTIPMIVTKCNEEKESTFFKKYSKKYDVFLRYIDGKEKSNANGLVGDGIVGEETYSKDKEGFVVLFYNQTVVSTESENIMDFQTNLEKAFKELKNNEEISNKLKFISVNVSWAIDSDDVDSIGKEGTYDNTYINREQQQEMLNVIKTQYQKQVSLNTKYGPNTNYVNKNIDEDKLMRSDVTLDKVGLNTMYHTIPSCFVTYTKNKSDEKYDLNNPNKVVFTKVGSTTNNVDALIEQYLDLYDIKLLKY